MAAFTEAHLSASFRGIKRSSFRTRRSMTQDPRPTAILDRLATAPYPDDPYPLYHELHGLGVVHHHPATGMAFVTTYEGCATVLRSPSFGQGENAARLRQDPRFDGSPVMQTLAHMVTFVDPPEHTRLRRLVSRAFTPRAVERLRPYVHDVVDTLLEPFERDGGGDLVAGYADLIPVTVVCQLVGVPHEEHGRCYDWAEAIGLAVELTVDDDALRRADAGAAEFRDYLRGLVRERTVRPQDDLLSALISTRGDDDSRFTEDELISMVIELVGAGFETTRNLIGSGILALIRNPDQLHLLVADPSLMRSAVEEFLRFEPPVQTAVPRFALEDVTVDGVEVEKGTVVGPMIGAANRDPRRFDDPDRLDVTRANNQPLTFAPGIHYCLGANVARLEGEIAIETVIRRWPALQLTSDPRMRPACPLAPMPRGPEKLLVTVS
jgi:cytochrome P450